MSTMKPAVGRKVWLWGASGVVLDNRQPFDATIVFVHHESLVNVSYLDHAGAQFAQSFVPLSTPRIPAPYASRPANDHGVEETHAAGVCATWMPYQVGQALAAAIGAAGPVTTGAAAGGSLGGPVGASVSGG